MTITESRRRWANVLSLAERGTPVVITSHGKPVAAVVSMAQLARARDRSKQTLVELFDDWKARKKLPKASLAEDLDAWRASIDPRDLEGPDPWKSIRDTFVDRGRPGVVFDDAWFQTGERPAKRSSHRVKKRSRSRMR